MKRRFLQTLLLTSTALLLAASIAGASAVYPFSVELDDGVYHDTAGGTVGVSSLNTGQTTRVLVKPPSAPARLDISHAAGLSFYSSPYLTGLQAGDVISVYQPSGAGSPTDSFTVPSSPVAAQIGGTTVTGSIPAGFEGGLNIGYRIATSSQPLSLKAGPFSAPVPLVIPGDTFYLNLASATDDYVSQLTHAPGETPLISVSATGGVSLPPGSPPSPGSFGIDVDNLMASVAPSVRVISRRGGTPYFDKSAVASGVSGSTETQPLPGDVIEVYRPQAAGAPSFTATIPSISAKFDPSVDLVAVDSPASGVLSVRVCRMFDCLADVRRTFRDIPAGRTFLDFATPQGLDPAVDLRSGDTVIVQWTNANYTFQYEYNAAQGDLVAPAQSLTISKKLRLSALLRAVKSGLKVKLKSNEAGSARLTLTLGKTRLASGTAQAKAGTVTVKLKFTKSGKKALKKLKARGRKFKSQKATLTSVLTDSSGNSSSKSKSTTIKR